MNSVTTPFQKVCCDFYEDPRLKLIFGDSLHPGGLGLTDELAERFAPRSSTCFVLDVGTGYGTTAIRIAETWGSSVIGIDISAENLLEAKERAKAAGLDHLVQFVKGDAHDINLPESCFKAAFVECCYCLFEDPDQVTREIHDVLEPGGVLVFSDVVVEGELPDALHDTLGQLLCIRETMSRDRYARMLVDAGFERVGIEDRTDAIRQLLTDVKKRLLVAELAAGLGQFDVPVDLELVKGIHAEVSAAVESGKLGYIIGWGYRPEDS